MEHINQLNIKTMSYFKITKNGKDLVTSLTKDEAVKKLFPTVEDFSNGYIYDNEAETIYNEFSGQVFAKLGDESVMAGDDYFEILEVERN